MSFTRVYRAIEILANIANEDVNGISTRLTDYENAYNSKRPGNIDSAFVYTVTTVNSKITLLLQRIETVTGVKFTEQFDADFAVGNTTQRTSCCETDYKLCCGTLTNWYNFDNDDYLLSQSLYKSMLESTYAGQAVSNLTTDTTEQSDTPPDGEDSNRSPVLPSEWNPGRDWLTSCPSALQNVTNAYSNMSWVNSLSGSYQMKDIYPWAFQLYQLQEYGITAIGCRSLYSDALTKARNGIDSVLDLINDFQQVSSFNLQKSK